MGAGMGFAGKPKKKRNGVCGAIWRRRRKLDDAETTVKGLSQCYHAKPHCNDCPYWDRGCERQLMRDALELLTGKPVEENEEAETDDTGGNDP